MFGLVHLEEGMQDIDIMYEFCAFLVREVNFGFLYESGFGCDMKLSLSLLLHAKVCGLPKASAHDIV